MKNKELGTYFIIGGLLLLAAALCLCIYNIREEKRAESSAVEALRELRPETETEKDTETAEVTDAPKETDASDDTAALVPEETEIPEAETAPVIPEYVLDPYIEMPETEINGERYIGIIDIPSLDISLPIINNWSYPRLKIAPCRYQGSVYLDNMIIAGHNYKSHFGSLVNINIGDPVYFTDMSGNVFAYKVVELETIGGTDIESMVSGDWDLTLFTCTLVRKTRVTVRCERAEN